MTVMTTAMHPAGNFRPKRKIRLLRHRQCIHIGAQPDTTCTLSRPKHAHNAGAADITVHLNAESALDQLLQNLSGLFLR